MTWYLARATGLVLLLVFTASTALGVISSTEPPGPDQRVPRFVVTDLHRRLSLLALLLLAGHIAVSVADSFVAISPLDAVVPFMGSYRRTWLGLGTVATDLTIAAAVTSGLRHRMSPRAWRAVHLGAYVAWPAVLLHGLGTGSDTRRLPVLVLTATCAAVVLAALGWRLVAHPVALPRVAAWTALAALPLLAVALAVWTAGGPLESGWAKRSGTPAAPTRTVPAADRVGAQ